MEAVNYVKHCTYAILIKASGHDAGVQSEIVAADVFRECLGIRLRKTPRLNSFTSFSYPLSWRIAAHYPLLAVVTPDNLEISFAVIYASSRTERCIRHAVAFAMQVRVHSSRTLDVDEDTIAR